VQDIENRTWIIQHKVVDQLCSAITFSYDYALYIHEQHRQQGHASRKTSHQRNPSVLNWRCRLTQVNMYNDCNMVVVVVVVVVFPFQSDKKCL